LFGRGGSKEGNKTTFNNSKERREDKCGSGTENNLSNTVQ